MSKYGIFRRDDAKRIARATRRVEGFPGTFIRVLERISRLHQIVPTQTEEDDGFPSGVTCDCDHCLQGVTIPDALECCRSHTAWEFTNPWLECETTDLVLEYMGGDKWITDPFFGPNGNEYRFQLTIDIDGRSYLTLLLETDNGGDPVCLSYGRDGFDCQCDNALTIKKPWGKLSGIDRPELACNVCLKPALSVQQSDCSVCDLPQIITVEVTGVIDDAGSNCSELNATYTLIFSGQDEETGLCNWLSEEYEITNTCTGTGTGTVYCGLTINGNGDTTVKLFVHYVSHAAPDFVLTFGGGDGTGCPTGSIECTETARQTLLACPAGNVCDNTGGMATVILNATAGPVDKSGACEDEDCAPADAEPQPQSACCLGDGHCYEYIDAALCADFGGTFYDVLDDCREACETTGGCCFPGGACVEDITEMECTLANGSTFHPLSVCAEGLCDAPTGACCVGGICTSTFEVDCDGEWRSGENCVDVDCTIGCCCHPTVAGACGGGNPCIESDNMTGETCEELNGDFSQEVACASVGCNCNGTTNLCRIP